MENWERTKVHWHDTDAKGGTERLPKRHTALLKPLSIVTVVSIILKKGWILRKPQHSLHVVTHFLSSNIFKS